ncbi:hypothetical protein BDV30DRAFT_243519 [Aspergillus minisclerotigenes]|uniref:Uncharacterized protein n=1 Tax=Aspergillus minisclerotigenes TaxID=656917 RepID=A0A5N6IPS7_9EURO|nr:hypothetical protein BDV30DRAFT_243519 [Aspergillus minisclerotigenes]
MSSLLAEQAAQAPSVGIFVATLFLLLAVLHSAIINVTMAPLSKRKWYTDLITSMGAGDSEPNKERIITTLARYMAKVGVLESGLTNLAVLKKTALKEIVPEKNGRATSSDSLSTATKSLLLTIRREGKVQNIQLDFSEESRRVKMYLEDKRQGNQLQRSTGNADDPGL